MFIVEIMLSKLLISLPSWMENLKKNDMGENDLPNESEGGLDEIKNYPGYEEVVAACSDENALTELNFNLGKFFSFIFF